MKILLINPNTSRDMTETINRVAKKAASLKTDITTLNPDEGPEFLANSSLEALQVPKVIDLVERNRENYDAFIIACGGDPGLDSCRILAKNVIGSGEAAIMTACAVAKKFSFLNTMAGLSILDRLYTLGIDKARCASVRVLGNEGSAEIVKKRHLMLEAYYKIGKKCIDEDGASALVLLCAGLCDVTNYLEERLGVPVISGVISAVKIAEQLPYRHSSETHVSYAARG